jgi:hypothetical protein
MALRPGGEADIVSWDDQVTSSAPAGGLTDRHRRIGADELIL